MTRRELDRLYDLLVKFSEEARTGTLRDHIAAVTDAVHASGGGSWTR